MTIIFIYFQLQAIQGVNLTGTQGFQSVNIGGQNILIPNSQIINGSQSLQLNNQGQIMSTPIPLNIGTLKTDGAMMQALQLQGLQGIQGLHGIQGIQCIQGIQGIQSLQVNTSIHLSVLFTIQLIWANLITYQLFLKSLYMLISVIRGMSVLYVVWVFHM